MIESKTLVLTMEEAQMHSLKPPDVRVRVMTKKRRKPVICCSDWVYRERVLEGWETYCSYLDGSIRA